MERTHSSNSSTVSAEPQTEDFRAKIRGAVNREDTFLQLTASGKARGGVPPWQKVTVRPVPVKGERCLQFTYFDGRKALTKNCASAASDAELTEVLAAPFSQFHVQATTGDLHVRLTKKGKALISQGKPSRQQTQPDLAHNRTKQHPLPVGKPDTFLWTTGVTDRAGNVRPAMRGKFRQVNAFLELFSHVLPAADESGRPLTIIDCGCGSAYLTFAAYHYSAHIQERPAQVVGVDSDAEIIGKCRRLQESLQWDGLSFHEAAIADFEPATPPDVILSLHACDTATDEAIAQGIRWQGSVILAAPCCQHELHDRVQHPLFQPVLRHGILKQRTADILTDAFRALVLRIMGYRTDVVEFVSPEHTSRNLLIRAVKTQAPGDSAAIQEYMQLKQFWNVTPYLEELLGDVLAPYLAAA